MTASSLQNDDAPDRPVRAAVRTHERASCALLPAVVCFPFMPETRISSAPAAARIENGENATRPPSDDFHRQPQGRFPLPRSRSGGRIVRAVGSAYTAAPRELMLPRPPQFSPWAVYIPGGGTTGAQKATDGDRRSASHGRGRGRRAFRELAESHRRSCSALLPDARPPRRAEDAVQGRMLAACGHRRVHLGTRIAAHLAVQIASNRCLTRAARRAAPARKLGHVSVTKRRATRATRPVLLTVS